MSGIDNFLFGLLDNANETSNKHIRQVGVKVGIFVTLLSQDAFESDCTETKFQTITS